MKKEVLRKILKEHKLWVENHEKGVCADLSGADLRCADLRCVDLSGADLRGADLRGANLRCADLRGANLRYADLREADLSEADLRCADLRYADLRCADLRGADLRGADLDYSCFPLWCGSLGVHMDDKQIIQLLYHTLKNVEYSNNVSNDLKEKLLTKDNLEIANKFHRVKECGKLKELSEVENERNIIQS